MEGEPLTSWNILLHAKKIFPRVYDNIRTKNSSEEAIVTELKDLLSNKFALQRIYNRYKRLFEKERDPSRSSGNPREVVHREMFRKYLVNCATHNLEARAGKHSWLQGVNQFADMTHEESQMFTCFIPPPVETNSGGRTFILGPLPSPQWTSNPVNSDSFSF